MKTKEINQWIHILSREEATVVREEEVDQTLTRCVLTMVVIQMIGKRGGINMIIEKNEIKENIAEVVVATAGTINATGRNASSHNITMSRYKLLNLKLIVAVVAA